METNEYIALSLDIDLGAAQLSIDNYIASQARLRQVMEETRATNEALRKQLKAVGTDEKLDLETQTRLRQDLNQKLTENEEKLRGISKAMRETRQEFQLLAKPIGEFEALNKKLREGETALKNMYLQGKQNSVEFAQLEKRVQGFRLELEKANQASGKSNFSDKLNKSLAGAGGKVLGGLGIALGVEALVEAAARGAKAVFDLNKDISDLQADIQKTTQLSAAQVDALTERLKSLDTRTPLSGLLQIANTAGQLGVTGEAALFKFTAAVDQLNVALGQEFGGNAEEVTDKVGRLSNVLFGVTTDGEELAQRLLYIGNALNTLGAEGSATSDVIVDFAQRIAALAQPLGVTEGEILGISATLQELGVNAERGGTAVGRVFQGLTQDADGFASAFGITSEVLKENGFEVENFADLVNTNLVGALQVVSNQVSTFEGGNIELSKALKEVRIDGAGELEVLLKLADANDRLTTNIETATVALTNQDSITAEVAAKNENLAGSYQRLVNNIQELFVSSGLENALTGIIQKTNEWFDIPVEEQLQRQQGELNGLVRALINTTEKIEQNNRTIEDANALDLERNTAIENVNLQEQVRSNLISELQSKYPDFLRNIDLEKATVDLLNTALAQNNQQYTQRILIQRQEKELNAIYEEQANLVEELTRLNVDKGSGKNRVTSGFIPGATEITTDSQISSVENRLKQLDEQIAAVNKRRADEQGVLNDLLGTTVTQQEESAAAAEDAANASATATQELEGNYDRLSARLKDVSAAIKNAFSLGQDTGALEAEYAAISAQLEQVDSRFKALSDTTVAEYDRLTARLQKLGKELKDALASGADTTALQAEYQAVAKQIADIDEAFKKLTKLDTGLSELSLEAMRERLSELNTELQKAPDEPAQAAAIRKIVALQGEIEKTQKFVDQLTAALEDTSRLQGVLAPLQTQVPGLSLPNNQQEVTAKPIVRDERIAQVLQNLEVEKQQALLTATQIAAERERIARDSGEDIKKVQAENLEQLTAIELEYENKAIQARLDADAAARAQGHSEALDAEKLSAAERLDLERQLIENEVELERNKNAKIIELRQQVNQQLKQIGFQFLNDLVSAQTEKEKKEADEVKEKKLEALHEEYDERIKAAEGNTKKQTQLRQELEEKEKEIEKEAFERKKKATRKQILIQGALAAVQALANTVVPFPASLLALIPVGAAVLAQLALLEQQQFALGTILGRLDKPKQPRQTRSGHANVLEKVTRNIASVEGVKFAKGTIFRGVRHGENGSPGIPIFDRNGGGFRGWVEDGEAVMTRNTTQTPRSLGLTSLVNELHGGRSFGGERPPKEVEQQIVQWLRPATPTINVTTPRPAPVRPVFANGTIVGSQQQLGYAVPDSLTADQVRQIVETTVSNLPPIYVDIVQFQKADAKAAQLKQNARLI